MKSANVELGACSVWGCDAAAVERAAPNVCYCARHAAGNYQTTRLYMNRLAEVNLRAGEALQREQSRRGVRQYNHAEMVCHACAGGVMRPTVRDAATELPILDEAGRLQADESGAIRRCQCGAWMDRSGMCHCAAVPDA